MHEVRAGKGFLPIVPGGQPQLSEPMSQRAWSKAELRFSEFPSSLEKRHTAIPASRKSRSMQHDSAAETVELFVSQVTCEMRREGFGSAKPASGHRRSRDS
jgi:hypothetical protein